MDMHESEEAPDLTDFMNDWFFGTAAGRRGGGAYDLTGESKKPAEKKHGKGGGSAGKLTEEWLEEAKKKVAGSPSRTGVASPSRLAGSPRFAGSPGQEPSPLLDRRDPMSRSARRHRQLEGIGDEILQRASLSPSPSPTSSSDPVAAAASLPPKQPPRRKSRFHDTTPEDSSHRRTASSSISASRAPQWPGADAAHHRRHSSAADTFAAAAAAADGGCDGLKRLNSFLLRQRSALAKLASGDAAGKARIVLSDASNSVSSIVVAISYAWLVASKGKGEAGNGGQLVVPVVNMRRRRMVKCRQAAWLLYDVGVDASALLFADEVDMEGLIVARKASLLVVGQDILKTNGEVGSLCTILTENYHEEAYNLLQIVDMKKLLLAGILLDTNNLSKLCTDRDADAVQLLSDGDGTSQHRRHELFQQLMLDRDSSEFLDYLKNTYRKSSADYDGTSPPDQKHPVKVSSSESSQDAKQSSSTNQKPTQSPAAGKNAKASDADSRGKNKFFLAKWFGFGSK